MYGFGGNYDYYKGSFDRMCFSMTGDENKPEVNGLNGIMSCYRDCLKKAKLSGPTQFAPVLKKAMELCKENIAK